MLSLPLQAAMAAVAIDVCSAEAVARMFLEVVLMSVFLTSGGRRMGLRFRKSFKIINGVRVNVSKTGASMSLGGKGASVNISSRGVRNTVGIPGTGISVSSNLRLSSFKNKTAKRDSHHTYTQNDVDELNSRLEEFKFIHTLTESPTEPLSHDVYKIRAFEKTNPNSPRDKVAGLLFLIALVLIACYILGDMPSHVLYFIVGLPVIAIALWSIMGESEEERLWRIEKDEFETEEARKAKEANKIVRNDPKKYAGEILKSAISTIEYDSLIFRQISAKFKIYEDTIFMHISLPSFDSTPVLEYKVSPAGRAITKVQLSELKRRNYYAQYIHGLAFLYIGKIFQALKFVDKIIASAYTSMQDSATGRCSEMCLFSVKVLRAEWNSINFSVLSSIDPVQALEKFSMTRNMSKKFDFKPIEAVKAPSEAKLVELKDFDLRGVEAGGGSVREEQPQGIIACEASTIKESSQSTFSEKINRNTHALQEVTSSPPKIIGRAVTPPWEQ